MGSAPDKKRIYKQIKTQKHFIKRILIKPFKFNKKMRKYLILFLATGLFSVGCDKTTETPVEEEYTATIDIISPADGEMGTVGQEMTIEAEIDREDNKIIHHVTVQIFDADGNLVETLVDNEHVHAEGHHHVNKNFTPMAQGEYTLRVRTNDHEDASKKVEAQRTFMVMAATYNVSIDIQEPTENTTINVNDDLPVKVVYTHDEGGVIHHVRIEILDAADNIVATLVDGHQHVAGTYTFESADAFTATASGTFRLVARTMNMDMSIMKMAERTFTVM